jgi:hypothetical protein
MPEEPGRQHLAAKTVNVIYHVQACRNHESLPSDGLAPSRFIPFCGRISPSIPRTHIQLSQPSAAVVKVFRDQATYAINLLPFSFDHQQAGTHQLPALSSPQILSNDCSHAAGFTFPGSRTLCHVRWPVACRDVTRSPILTRCRCAFARVPDSSGSAPAVVACGVAKADARRMSGSARSSHRPDPRLPLVAAARCDARAPHRTAGAVPRCLPRPACITMIVSQWPQWPGFG